MRQLVIGTALLALLAATSQAQFTGVYDHANWQLDLREGDGSAVGDSTTLTLTGSNTNYRIYTTYTIKAPGDGVFSFDWQYLCEDEYDRLDTAGYTVDGVPTLLALVHGESGSVSVPVLTGQEIGFFADTYDGMDQPGIIIVTNFSGPAASGAPVGACCFLHTGCVDGLYEEECIREGGVYQGDGTTCAEADCGGEPPQYLRPTLRGENMNLSRITGSFSAEQALTFNSQDNEFAVTWTEQSVPSKTAIGVHRVSVAGDPVGSPLVIDLPAGYQVTPRIIYNTVDNEYLVDWRWQGASSANDYNSLRGQRLTADLSLIGSDYALTSKGIGFEGALVHNPQSNEYFVAARGFNPVEGVFAGRISGGTVVERDILLDDEEGLNGTPAPVGEAAYNSWDNEYLTTFACQANPTWSSFHLRGRIVAADGTVVTDLFEVSYTPNFRSFYEAATVAFDPHAGRYFVVYGDTRPLPLRGQFVSREGVLMGPPFEITGPMLDIDVAPSMDYDPVNNVYLVAWCQSPIVEPVCVIAQLVGADGTPLGEPLTLNAPTAFHRATVQANTNDGGFLVAWRDQRHEPGTIAIYGQFVDVEAFLLGDLDDDGDVDLADLQILLSNYGQTGVGYTDGDLDGDEDVDLADLQLLLSKYGDVL